jgi:hypothetical protein
MAKETKKRPDTPLAETPTYNMDASTLAEKLKKVQTDSDARRVASATERKTRVEARRKTMDRESRSSSSTLKGLNTSLGEKIITK